MTIEEAIRRYYFKIIIENGQEMLKATFVKKTSPEEVVFLKANKPAIIAEIKRRAEEKATTEAKELAAILSGEKLITVYYHDGEYLSGYTVHGKEAKELEKIGFAKYISGWGFYVEAAAVKALGETFSYPAVIEHMRPAVAARETKKAKVQAERQAKFDEAKATGKEVILRSWSEDCCDPDEECNVDNHAEWAMPDGSISHTWGHTWQSPKASRGLIRQKEED